MKLRTEVQLEKRAGGLFGFAYFNSSPLLPLICKPPLVYIIANDYLYTPNGNIFPTNYVQMLKAIVVVYTIKTGMSNIWQLSGSCP